MRKFPWSPVLPILFLLLSTGIHVIEPTFVEQMRHRVFDEYQRLKPRAYSNDIPVRILDIDDESLSRVGQWPWPRDVMAEIVAVDTFLATGLVFRCARFAKRDVVAIRCGRHLIFLRCLWYCLWPQHSILLLFGVLSVVFGLHKWYCASCVNCDLPWPRLVVVVLLRLLRILVVSNGDVVT